MAALEAWPIERKSADTARCTFYLEFKSTSVMKQNLRELKDELSKLQHQLAQVDLLAKPSSLSSSGFIELQLVKLRQLKLKMYPERTHSRPHVHVDYGSQNHVGSFAINPPARLAGSLAPKYDKTVIDWISLNNQKLLEIWDSMQSGGNPSGFIAELKEDV